MTGEKIDLAEAAASDDGAKRTRQRSEIEFPYDDLNEAITVARAIHDNAGDRCAADQLAGWMNTTITSGSFRGKLTIARCFGLIEGGIGSEICLTEIGRMIMDPGQEREGRAQAFLAVPLYNRVFEDHRGHVLPPSKALERKMADYGVPDKSAGRARQVFDRAAEQAGFFASGRDRLVRPATGHRAEASRIEAGIGHSAGQATATGISVGSGAGGGTGHGDPLIAALISKLPASGTPWPVADRVMWLNMISMAFQMAYGQEPLIEIKGPSIDKIP